MEPQVQALLDADPPQMSEPRFGRAGTVATDTPVGQLAHLEARDRAHARVEDRIRCAKSTGLAVCATSTPSGSSSSPRLRPVCLDAKLLLDGALAVAEPRQLR